MTNRYAIQVSWSPPNMSNCTDVDEYRISCNISYPCSYTYTRQTTSTSTILFGSYFSRCNYTCCVSGSNSAGESPEECASKREFSRWILIARPTPPRNVAVSSIHPTNSITLTWTEPAESYGQAILFYSINCTSAHHNVEIQRTYTTSVNVSGLIADTNYTCCVSAENSGGVGLHTCIVMTAIGTGTICNALKGYYSYYSLQNHQHLAATW